MNVIEQADLARRWIDDPLITIRRSELREALYEYGETQYIKAKYARYHRAAAMDPETAEMYAERWAEANDKGWRLFFATLHPEGTAPAGVQSAPTPNPQGLPEDKGEAA